jgi:hypothetical protein
MSRKAVLSFVFLGFIAASTVNATVFSGSLSSASGQIAGLGVWINPGPTSIAWEVTDVGTYYHYKYTLTVPQADVSHFIVEVSPLAEISDFSNLSGPFQGSPVVDDYDQTNGNPTIPGPLHGLKLDNVTGTNVVFEFDSVRVPVWGDFYAKCGALVPNQAWNAGFSLPDPVAPAAGGTIDNHILVPDSRIVPEPAMLALLLIGGVTALRKNRRP